MSDPSRLHRDSGIPHWDADCARCGNEIASKLLSEGTYTFVDTLMNPMWLCPTCGSKRCPRAMWHEYECAA